MIDEKSKTLLHFTLKEIVRQVFCTMSQVLPPCGGELWQSFPAPRRSAKSALQFIAVSDTMRFDRKGEMVVTRVKIDPGICGLKTKVEACAQDETAVKVKIDSACPSIKAMAEALGEDYDAYELCLQKPGAGPFYDYAREHFPVHVSCPALNGIIKCVEVECRLALKKNASIEFIEEE